MIKIAVCDDEQLFVEKLTKMIYKICNVNDIDCKVSKYCTAVSLLEECSSFHAIFIDIDMPYTDGITAAQKINRSKNSNKFPLVVFVTNRDDLVFQALKEYPFVFLRKSCFSEEIEQCIIHIFSEVNTTDHNSYEIKNGRTHVILNLYNIMYVEKEKNYVRFISEKETYKERCGIKEKYNDLRNKGFVQVHIGFLVNLRYILEIQTNNILLSTGQLIPLSKKYRDIVKQEFFEWIGRNND